MNKSSWKALEYARDGMFVPQELTEELLDSLNIPVESEILVLFSYEMIPVLHERGYRNITLATGKVKKYVHNFAHRYSCAVKEINEVTNMRFDVTIGNPPYQQPAGGENDSKNAQGSFWWKFTEQAMEYSDTVAMVTPTSIFSVGGFGSSTNKVTKVRESGFNFTHIWKDVDDHFDVGIRISAFVIKKTEDAKCSLVQEGCSVSLPSDKPVPTDLSENAVSIINKVYSGKNWKFTEGDKSSENELVVKINGGRFKKYSKLFVGTSADTPHSAQTLILGDENVENVESVFKSKLFEFVFIALGGELGNSSTGILQSLPKVDLSRVWNDAELYEHFGLTDAEIEYVG